MSVSVTTFRPEHAERFAALNREWLIAHDLLEALDEEQLADPHTHLIAPGGTIFVAEQDGVVVGTCAIVPTGEGTSELVKLAVDPAARGAGIGRRLVERCLAQARTEGIRTVTLISSTRLQAALRLYESCGFRHGPLPVDSGYVTADVFMEIDLDVIP